jgi:hypothetical protein
MGGEYRTHGEIRNYYKILTGNLKGTNHLGHPRVPIWEHKILEKWSGKVWIGIVWLTIRSNSGLL